MSHSAQSLAESLRGKSWTRRQCSSLIGSEPRPRNSRATPRPCQAALTHPRRKRAGAARGGSSRQPAAARGQDRTIIHPTAGRASGVGNRSAPIAKRGGGVRRSAAQRTGRAGRRSSTARLSPTRPVASRAPSSPSPAANCRVQLLNAPKQTLLFLCFIFYFIFLKQSFYFAGKFNKFLQTVSLSCHTAWIEKKKTIVVKNICKQFSRSVFSNFEPVAAGALVAFAT